MDKALAVVVATFSPTLLFNAAIWGQFDGLLVLLLFLCFYSVSTKRIYWASAFYAIGCLTKLQFCYFIFPFAAIVILFYPLRKIVIATLEGLAIGLLGWLPFMVVSGPSLPLRIYLGGSGKYPFLNLSALILGESSFALVSIFKRLISRLASMPGKSTSPLFLSVPLSLPF